MRDLLLTGGRTPEPVALRLSGGCVIEVGPHLEPRQGERVLDLGGRFVRHGLRDAHAHVVEWARSRREVDLSPARSAAATAGLVAAAYRDLPPGAAVRGSGFRDALWSDEARPELLAAAAPGCLVVLRSLDMHTAWLSPAALAAAGLPGDRGLLREHEAWQALGRLPAPAPEEDDDAVEDAVAAAHARGLTAVRDFSFEDAHGSWERRTDGAGALPLRVTAVVLPERVPALVARGLRTGDGNGFLRVGPVKLFADGALGARTARCLTPYADGSGHGEQLLDPAALVAALADAAEAGFGVAVHAIGDEATRDALRVLQYAPRGASIEHAQLVRREDLPLFAAGGVVASVQPAHVLDDAGLVDDVWRHTGSLPYPLASLVAAGARLVLGSDAPVSPMDPWRSLTVAVHRTDGTRPPWRPQEVVPLEVALAAAGARRLRAGDDADLVVLDVPDPAALSAADLMAVPVHATYVAGRCVHGPERDVEPGAPGSRP